MADRKPLKVLPDGGGDSTGLGEFVEADTIGVVDGGTGLATVGSNQLLTGNGTSALTSESNLTFDGSTLTVSSSAQIPTEINSSNANPYLVIAAEAETQNDTAGIAFNATKGQAIGGANTMAKIYAKVTNSGGNPLYGNIYFHTTSAETDAEKMIIASDGNVTISDGDLVIGTSGHGIDFSAHGQASGMTGELLDDYEIGNWTAVLTYSSSYTTYTCTENTGKYVKIGRLVYVTTNINVTNPSASNSSTVGINVTGLPFTVTNDTACHSRIIFDFSKYNGGSTLMGMTAYVIPNTTIIQPLRIFNNGAGWAGPNTAEFYLSSGTAGVFITGCYHTDA